MSKTNQTDHTIASFLQNIADDASVNSSELADLNPIFLKRKQKSKKEEKNEEPIQGANIEKSYIEDDDDERNTEVASNMEAYSPDTTTDKDMTDTHIEQNAISEKSSVNTNANETIDKDRNDTSKDTRTDTSTDDDEIETKTVSCLTKTDKTGFKVKKRILPSRINKKNLLLVLIKSIHYLNNLVKNNIYKFCNSRLRIPVKSNLRYEV